MDYDEATIWDIWDISNILVSHTRMNVEGLCYCGWQGKLGSSFTIHQAEMIWRALNP
jgi:hypothetical protein